MNAATICEDLKRGLGALFVCEPHGRYIRIRTPYLYPDGDIIDLFLKEEGDITFVTDLGETTRWLRMQTLSFKRSPKQRALIEDICLNHGVELYKGMVVARQRHGDSLAAVVQRVSQACLRIYDLWFTFKTRAIESVTDEVADFLSERHFDFERNVKLAGRSGRTWRVDFHVMSIRRGSLVYVLSTGNRSAARSVAEHVLAAWYDLNHLAVGPEALRFISLFDDTLDVWTAEDFKLVERLSTIARWSQPDEFADLLKEAA
ncbi:MAG: DUF1828 domain-containing protein [Nitrospirae bacterium]|nr:MAG: DUF1828 domain-containing protein [Nitrospirota bacterium]